MYSWRWKFPVVHQLPFTGRHGIPWILSHGWNGHVICRVASKRQTTTPLWVDRLSLACWISESLLSMDCLHMKFMVWTDFINIWSCESSTTSLLALLMQPSKMVDAFHDSRSTGFVHRSEQWVLAIKPCRQVKWITILPPLRKKSMSSWRHRPSRRHILHADPAFAHQSAFTKECYTCIVIKHWPGC